MARPPITAICRQSRYVSTVLFILLAACGSVVLTGCGGDKGTAPKASSGGGEIVIGHYASLTGGEATFGRSTDNGIQMAVEEINAAGGVNGSKVKVITYDDKGEKPETGTAVTRLVTKDGVVAVLGEVASSL